MLQRVAGTGLLVETVLLIGGATRMPLLRQELKAVLPVEPTVTMYADMAVAMGGVPRPAAEPTGGTSLADQLRAYLHSHRTCRV